jgi:hypothetical protein
MLAVEQVQVEAVLVKLVLTAHHLLVVKVEMV